MTDEETRLRTAFFTYEAGDDAADTLMVVVGSVLENFRGVRLVEYQDDTVFAEGEDPMTVLHQMATAKERLTPEQREELESFTQAIQAWEERGGGEG